MRKKFLHKLVLMTIAFSVMAFVSIPKAHALDDAIIAIVNNEVITMKDLREYLNTIYMGLVSEGLSEEEIKKEIELYQAKGLEKLIETKLLVHEADQKGMEIRQKVIQDRIDSIKKQYSTDQDFLNDLVKNGMSLSDLLKKITDQMKAKYVVEMEVRAKIYVNPQEVTEYYNEHKKDFTQPERLNVKSIFIMYSTPSDKTEAQRKGIEALRLINEGSDFDEISKQYSNAPSLGVINKGELKGELESELFKLSPGDVSSLIEVENGIYIFKILGKATQQTVQLKDVKDKIYNMLFQEKFKKRYQTWVYKLKEKAYIEVKE